MAKLAEELNLLTVKALRAIASERLGAKGGARLRTKPDLVAALAKLLTVSEVRKVMKAPTKAAPKKGTAAPRNRQPATSRASGARPATATRRTRTPTPTRTLTATRPTATRPTATRPTGTPTIATRNRTPTTSRRTPTAFDPRLAPHASAQAERKGKTATKTPVEGPGARAKPSTFDLQPSTKARRAPRSEQLGELPDRYEDDSLGVLPVDPGTLFIWWDFSRAAVARAAEGLSNPRARLAIIEGEAMVREVDLALESRAFYVRGLPPGRRYQAEIQWVDSRGRRSRIGPSSAPVSLPPRGPSARVDDRFVTFRFDGTLGPGVDPSLLPAGLEGGAAEGLGWGSSEHGAQASGVARPRESNSP
jgi:hypothetical protein